MNRRCNSSSIYSEVRFCANSRQSDQWLFVVEGVGTDLIELTLDCHFHGPYTLSPSLAIAALESVMHMRIPLPLIIGRVPVGRGVFTMFVIEAVDTRMTAGLSIPKMTTADAAKEILDGFESGEEDIYVGEMARGLAQGLAHDPKGVERQLASPG